MQDIQRIQSEQDSLNIINSVARKSQSPETSESPATPKPAEQDSGPTVESNLMLDEVALPELTDEFNPKKKLRRSIPFQFFFLGTFVIGLLGLVRGCSTMNEAQVSGGKKAATAAPLGEGERQKYISLLNSQKLLIQELKQGKRVDVRSGKNATLPKPAIDPAKVNKASTPPPAATTTKTIPVRPAAPVKPKVIYKERVVYKDPPKPEPKPKPELKPVQKVALTQTPDTPPLQPQPVLPPKLTARESGTLIASTAMTGDLLQDMSATGGQQRGGTTPGGTSLVAGSIPAGTKVKAAFRSPLTWVAGQEVGAGQRILLTLKEDLEGVAEADSTAIGEVMSVQGDFAQVQIVEINGQSIDHVNRSTPDPESSTRHNPIAIVQHKDTPYLQAKAKGQGQGLGSKLLRAGVDAGVDQLRGSGVGRRASNVVNSLVPDNQRNQFDQGGQIFSFEGKDVEIYFLEGV